MIKRKMMARIRWKGILRKRNSNYESATNFRELTTNVNGRSGEEDNNVGVCRWQTHSKILLSPRGEGRVRGGDCSDH